MKGNLGKATLAIILVFMLFSPFLVSLIPSKMVSASPDPDTSIYDLKDRENGRAWHAESQGPTPTNSPTQILAGSGSEQSDFSSADYDDIENDDTSYAQTAKGDDFYDTQYYTFHIEELYLDIDNILIKWIGYGSEGDGRLWVWKQAASAWQLLDTFSTGEKTIDNIITADFDDYLYNDNLWLAATTAQPGASCPVLYTWDGSEEKYIYPISVNSGLSFPGYEVPDEFKEMGWKETPFQIPKSLGSTVIRDDLLVAENGLYKLWVTEEMDEITYTDSLRLFKVYHPIGTEVYSSLPIVYQEFELEFPYFHTVSDPISPIEAYNERGEDILSLIEYPDEIWTKRAIGQQYFWTILDFGRLDNPERVKLIVKADTEWFNTPPFKLPFVEVWYEDNWVRVMARPDSIFEGGERVGPGPTIVWDITDWFPENTSEYKLRFNDWQAKAYDYIALDTSEDFYYDMIELPMDSAVHFFKGRGRFYDNAYHFDDIRETISDYAGYFTKYGDVSEVILYTDDMFVISQPGDAIEVTYQEIADLSDEYLDLLVELGLVKRSYILLSDSYFKGYYSKWFENTKYVELEPLPFHAMSYYPYPENESFPWDNEHLEWWNEYQTRYIEPTAIVGHTLYTDYIRLEVNYEVGVYPTQPTLYLPPNKEEGVDNTPYFEWILGENADNHRLLVDNEDTFSEPLNENRIFTAGDNYEIADENSLLLGEYFWKVIAINEDGETSSVVWMFHVGVRPLLRYPEHNKILPTNTPTFLWTIVEDFDNHRLLVDNSPNFASPIDNEMLGATENTWIKDAPGYDDGTYYWKVMAISEDENRHSTVWTFYVENPEWVIPPEVYSSCGCGAPVNAIDDDLDSTWTPTTQIHYHWIIFDMEDNVWNLKVRIYQKVQPWGRDNGLVVYISDNVDDFGDNVWEGVMNETHQWNETSALEREDCQYIKLVSKEKTTLQDMWEFRTYVTPSFPSQPQLIEPEDDIFVYNNTPTFKWTETELTDDYQLQVDDDFFFSTPILNIIVAENSYISENVLPNDNYYWRVIAKHSGYENVSETRAFTLYFGEEETGLGDYLIITRPLFGEAMYQFKVLKESQGYTTMIAFWGWIDVTFEGQDDAEKMRNCIKAYRDNGVEYVLIAGGYEFDNVTTNWSLPMRKVNFGGDDMAAPIYFANLDGNFDNNLNGVYGEWNGEDNMDLSPFVNAEINENEEIDWYPDIYVGWFLTSSSAKMTSIVQKNVDWTPYTDIDNVIGCAEDPGRYENEVHFWASWGYVNTLWREENWWIEDIYVDEDPKWRDQFLPTSINPIVGHMATGEYGDDNRDNNFGGTGLSYIEVFTDNDTPFFTYMGEVSDLEYPGEDGTATKPKVLYNYGCVTIDGGGGMADDALAEVDGGGITYIGSSETLTGYDWWENVENQTIMLAGDKALMTSFWKQFFRYGESRPGVAFWEAFRELIRESNHPLLEMDEGNKHRNFRRVAATFFCGDPSLQAVEVQWKQSDTYYQHGMVFDNLVEIKEELEGIVGRFENWESTLFEDNFFTLENIGYSVEGRDMLMMSFGEGTTNVLIRGGIHGDEHEGCVAAMNFINWFATRMNRGEPYPENMTSSWNWTEPLRTTIEDRAWRANWSKVAYENIADSDFVGWLQNLRFYVVPIINVDAWMADTRNNANDVDLNRNFPYAGYDEPDLDWEYHENNWGNWDTVNGEDTQPEMWALLNLDEEMKFILEISYHSEGDAILYPWAMSTTFEEPWTYENVPLHKWYEEIGELIENEQDGDDFYDVVHAGEWLHGYGLDNIHSSCLDWFGWENKHHYDGTQSDLQGIKSFAIELYAVPGEEHSYEFVNQLPMIKVLFNWAKDYQAFYVEEEPVDWEYFELLVPITSSGENLENIDKVRIWIYRDSRWDEDDTDTHYTFDWEREIGFSEPSYPVTHPHLIIENCENYDNSKQRDNIRFAISLDNPNLGVWHFGAKVWDYEISQVVESSYQTGFILSGPEIMDLYSPSSVSPNTVFEMQVEIYELGGLALVEEIHLKIYENAKDNTQHSNENTRDFYFIRWTKENSFEEIGPDNTTENHLVLENSSSGDNTLEWDNWTFGLKLAKMASPKNWHCYVQAWDNNDVTSYYEFENQFSVNKHFELEQSTDTLKFGGYPGSVNNASYQNPVVLTISTNYNFNLTVRISGTFTNENENIWFENSDGGTSRFKLTTSAQTSYYNVSWGENIEKLEYYFIDIPIEIGPGKYFVDFYTEYEEA